MEKNKTVLVIVGPTASGKSALAIKLCQSCNGEVVSADSMQIYKGMDIGTAKPTLMEQEGVRHHLIDIVNPDEAYSVAQWQTDAKKSVSEILSRSKLPVVVGGTGLYISSIIRNLVFGNAYADLSYRNSLYEKAGVEGARAVYELLCRADAQSASKIHPNNLVRVVRALEIIYVTGEPVSRHHEKSLSEPSAWNFKIFGLKPERDLLYQRINSRVQTMLEAGLLTEVNKLLSKGYDSSLQSMQGIGYKELAKVISGECSCESAFEQICQASRNYAKRQITWFSRLDGVNWINPEHRSIEDISADVKEIIKS